MRKASLALLACALFLLMGVGSAGSSLQIEPVNATEGQAFNQKEVAEFAPSDLGQSSCSGSNATIDWGDGSATTPGNVSGSGGTCIVFGGHTYAEDGFYTMSIVVSGTGTTGPLHAQGEADVGEDSQGTTTGVAPIATMEGTAFQGTVATFTDPGSSTDPLSSFAAGIDWGDGSTPSFGTITESGGTYTVTGRHTYTDEGSDTIKVTISEHCVNCQIGSVTDSVTVSEADVLAGAQSSPFAATAGSSFSGPVAAFTDQYSQSPSDFTATIDWGDGSTPTGGTVSGSGGNFTVDGNHTYAVGGDYTVTTTLADDSPGTASANEQTTAEVSDVVTAVSTTLTSGSEFKAGGAVPVTVTFTGPVVVAGVPQLALNDGGVASYTSGSGTNTLTFTYTVSQGENASPLDYASTTALTLNGGKILGLNYSQPQPDLTLPTVGGTGDGLYAANLVIDTTPPTITVPTTAVTASATGPSGATVSYANLVSFSDNLTGVPTSGCTPASGSPFPIGSTTVNCNATDGAGNNMTASFTVKVLSPAQQATILLSQVTLIGQSGLIKTVQGIQADIGKNHTSAACGDLTNFIGLVKAQTNKTLTTAQASTLIGEATNMKSTLGC
jgi:hypothetical protein